MTTRMTAIPSSTSVLPTGEAKVARIIMTSSRTRPKWAAAPGGAALELLVERSVTVRSTLSRLDEAGYQLTPPVSPVDMKNAAATRVRRCESEGGADDLCGGLKDRHRIPIKTRACAAIDDHAA